MLAAIDHVAEMISGMREEDFEADLRTRRAVERCLEIVSEASRRIHADRKARFPDIAWRDIADAGNFLRHEYQRVSVSIVWSTAKALGTLREAVAELAASAAEPGAA